MEKKTIKQKNTGLVRTIITNAVYGRASQTFNSTVGITFNDDKVPSRVLGATIRSAEIKECFLEEVEEGSLNVRVEGVYEVHVWYELNDDTQIIKNNVRFSEIIPVKCLGGEFYGKKQVVSWMPIKPKTLSSSIIDRSGLPAISVEVEYELGVEVIGEAKINVLSYDSGQDETSGLNSQEMSNNENNT